MVESDKLIQQREHICVILWRPSSALRCISGLDGSLSLTRQLLPSLLLRVFLWVHWRSTLIHSEGVITGVECQEGVKRGKKSAAPERCSNSRSFSSKKLAKTHSCCLKNVWGQEGKRVYVTAKRKRSHWISHMAAGAAEDGRCCPWLAKKKPAEGPELGLNSVRKLPWCHCIR